MIQYSINHYIPIVFTSDDECIFCVEGYLVTRAKNNKIKLNNIQHDTLKEMISGKNYDLNFLRSVFQDELINHFIAKKIFIETEKVDIDNRYSRSKAFYNAYKMNLAHTALASKSVLILGCGGLGSHVAWNMAALGVLKIYLVDFDMVEESNLNRQLMYTAEDIGRKKTTALKMRLQEYNPDILIDQIDMKITSIADMQMLCKENKFDLLIKAIDTPQQSLQWVDIVCKEMKIPYINAFLMDNQVAIGPTFIPGITCGAELLPISNEETYGISGSICMQFYHMAAEVACEAFKILTGQGVLKYTNKVVFDNVITGERKVTSVQDGSGDSLLNNIIPFTLIAILLIVLALRNSNWIAYVTYAVPCILLPVVFYYKSVNAAKVAFLNTCFFFLGRMVIQLFYSFNPIVQASFTTYLMIFSLFILLSFFALTASIASYLLCELKRYIIKKRF